MFLESIRAYLTNGLRTSEDVVDDKLLVSFGVYAPMSVLTKCTHTKHAHDIRSVHSVCTLK